MTQGPGPSQPLAGAEEFLKEVEQSERVPSPDLAVSRGLEELHGAHGSAWAGEHSSEAKTDVSNTWLSCPVLGCPALSLAALPCPWLFCPVLGCPALPRISKSCQFRSPPSGMMWMVMCPGFRETPGETGNAWTGLFILIV